MSNAKKPTKKPAPAPEVDAPDEGEKPTATEVLKTLTGYDEIAVAKAFGADISDLRRKPVTFLRALVFVLKRREGLKDAPAKHAVLSMQFGDVNDYFADDPEDDPEGADLGDEDDESDPKGS